MEVTADLKYLHISPKKIKELGKISVGLRPSIAIERLTIAKEKGGTLLAKCLKSAYDNAINTHKLDGTKLRVKSIQILKGPYLKRFRPVSRGMAHSIKKRTTHVKVVLATIEEKKINSQKELPQKQVQDVKKGIIK